MGGLYAESAPWTACVGSAIILRLSNRRQGGLAALQQVHVTSRPFERSSCFALLQLDTPSLSVPVEILQDLLNVLWLQSDFGFILQRVHELSHKHVRNVVHDDFATEWSMFVIVFLLQGRSALAFEPTSYNPPEPAELGRYVESDPVARDVTSQMYPQSAYLVVLAHPHSRILGPHAFHSVVTHGGYDGLLQHVDVASRPDAVALKVDNGICDQLTRTVERGLTTSQGFVELCFPPWCLLGQICLLLRCHGADFATATGVHRLKLGSDYRGLRGRRCGSVARGRLMGKELLD